MTVSEDVSEFVEVRLPQAFCDDCIAKELGKNRHQIQAITITLGTTAEFTRQRGGCAECRNEHKFAIRSN